MSKAVAFGQIGVGYWGPNHLRNLISHPECRVVRVADRAEERCAFVRSTYAGVDVTTDAEDLLRDPEIEAIVIATPVHTHADLAVRALEAGKHVLVEKPLATSTTLVDHVAAVAKANERVAMVGHTFLFNEAVHALRRVVRSEDFGEIRYLHTQRLNLGRIRSDVDVVWNLAPHDVSILQYLLDDAPPVSVRVRARDYIQPGIADVAFIDIEYPGGIFANVHVSWLEPHKTRRLTVVGSRKMVVYDDTAEHKLRIYDKGVDRVAVLGEGMDFDRPAPLPLHHGSGDVVLPRVDFPEPLRVELEHFLACIRDGVPCRTGTDHARGVVDILERAERTS